MNKWPIRRYILLLASILVASLMLVLLILFRTSMMGTLEERERDSVEQQARMAVGIVKESLSNIPVIAHGLSRSEAAYAGVRQKDMSIFEDHLQAHNPQKLYKINLTIVMDGNGSVLYCKNYDYIQNTNKYFNWSMLPQLIAVSQQVKALAGEPMIENTDTLQYGVSGFIEMGSTWYYISAFPIMAGDGVGPSFASLILGREISEAELSRVLSGMIEAPIRLDRSSNPAVRADVDNLDTGQIAVVPTGPQTIRALYMLPTLQEQKMVLHLEQPRTLYRRGEEFVVNALILFWLAGFATMIALFQILERLVLLPLKNLSESVGELDASRIGQDEQNQLMLGKYRGQELNVLVQALQRMLDRIAVSQKIIEKGHSTMRIYSRAIQNTADDVLILLENGNIEYANPAAQENMGYPMDEIVGRSIYEFISESPELTSQIRQEIAQKRSWKGEISIFSRDAFPETEDVSFTPILNDQDEVDRIIAIKRNVEEKKRYEEMLLQLAHYDTLTQLPNRYYMNSQLEQAIEEAEKTGEHVAFFLMDVNNFKIINDTMGHAWGDEALKMLALRLDMQFPTARCVARVGGDEFAVLITGLIDESETQLLAERILMVCEQPLLIQEREFMFGFSVGLSVYPKDGDTADILFQNADTAMYIAKARHTSSCERFNETFFHTINERVEMEHALRRALKKDEFRAYFQPQIDTQSRRIVGSEALIRWQSPKGLIMPQRFISVADETGMIVPITWWMLEQACRVNQGLIDKGHNLTVAVNIPAQVLNHSEFLTRVRDTLERTGMAAHHLSLELTEDALISDAAASNHILGRLQHMGISVAIDDFGTGYSSLSYLKRLNINWLKLDRSFVAGIPDIEGDTAIVRATIDIARSLNLRVMAEGVENERQLEVLRQFNCHQFQGYLVSQPLPEEEFTSLICGER